MSDELAHAMALYAAGSHEDAYAALKNYLAADPHPAPQAYLAMAQCCAKLEQFQEAATIYRRAAQLLPAQTKVLMAIAEKVHQAGIEKASRLEIELLKASRQVIRAGCFDSRAWQTYRATLRHSLNIDEMRMSDQAMRDRLVRRQEAYYLLDSQTTHLSWCDDETLNGLWTSTLPAPSVERMTWTRPAGARIKIAYLLPDTRSSPDIRQQVLSLAAGHDRERFDVTLIGNVLTEPDEGTAPLGLLSIGALAEHEAVKVLRSVGLDILVDPLGHADGGHPALLRHRIAPLQVAIAGHPGPRTGLVCDYVMADDTVLPKEQLGLYAQAICHLPDAFTFVEPTPQPPTISRDQFGLPEGRIVFAAFHPSDLVSPRTADLWCAILQGSPGSVLWLDCESDYARDNLRTWMTRQTIAKDRLIFTQTVAAGEHSARMQLADIGLDCTPFNSLSFVRAALRSGLPVPALAGQNFAGRMSASLLKAAGLGELIAGRMEDYIDLCIGLARDDDLRERLKRTLLAGNTGNCRLEQGRFISHLESAWQQMANRAAEGLPPESFGVSRI